MLNWVKDEDETQTEALMGQSGAVSVGYIRKSVLKTAPLPGWRWEIVGLPGLPIRSDDRTGWADTPDEAKAKVQEFWDRWLAAAGLQVIARAHQPLAERINASDYPLSKMVDMQFHEVTTALANWTGLDIDEVTRQFSVSEAQRWYKLSEDDCKAALMRFCEWFDKKQAKDAS